MRENNELTQFSIYKINIEKVEETILLKKMMMLIVLKTR